jgi:hypothetical protein
VDHIHSGPAHLVLDKPLCVPSCDFNELLQALQSSETIRFVTCRSQVLLRVAEDKWVLLVKALGRINDIRYLEVSCTPGILATFIPFQAVACAVNNAHSLLHLRVATNLGQFPREPSGMTTLANALREHTGLQEISWSGCESPRRPRDPRSLDPVLLALPACPHLRKVFIATKYASADALKNLLQLPSATDLHLLVLEKQEHLLAVTNEIRCGRCNVHRMTLVMIQGPMSETTDEAVKAVASAIRLDQKLECLHLRMYFSDEAGVALAEALMVNKTLRNTNLRYCKATLGAQAYEAFSAMLRINTSIVITLPPFGPDAMDERLSGSCKQMRIEQRLNEVGRGRLLASRQTTREEYVDALNELNSYYVSDVDESPAFEVSCLYSLLRLNPSIDCMS